jgi:rfaE bifunctional protein kinase chain/domain
MTVPQSLPTAERLLALVAAMAGQPLVVAADLVADRFITGTPKRISREAPVLILRYEGERLVPGGGANAVANVAALGGRPLVLGVVGDDASGEGLLAMFRSLGVDTAGILVRRGYRTPTKTRILAGGRHAIKQQVVRYDVEDSVELSAADLEALAAALERGAGPARVAVVSDYGYGAACPHLAALLRRRLPAGSVILADSRYRLADFRGLDGATPNEEEAEALLGRPLGEAPPDLEASGAEVRRRLGTGLLLVTRGSRGMSLFSEEGTAHLPVHGTDQVADVTGAGDTVIGTFALALAAGASALEAALLANYAGGVVVMKMGTATLTPDELKQAVASDPVPRERLRWAGR